MSALSALFTPNASAEAKKTALRTAVAGFGSLGGGYLVAWLVVHQLLVTGNAPQLTGGVNAFTVLFVLALAIERLIQPFAPALGPDSAVEKEKLRVAQATQSITDITAAEAKVADARSKTALVTWGVATGVASLLASGLNVSLLRSMVDAQSAPAYWLDLLVTGLVVGAGTKPLNDMWTRLQAKP